jgi:hypothetical protein
MKFSVFQGCKAIGRSTKATTPPCATRTAVEFVVGLRVVIVVTLDEAVIVVLAAVAVVVLAALLFETAKLKNRMRTSAIFPDI